MDMIAKVGAAILEAETAWTAKGGISKERALASAAIEAMREPSNDMLQAMYEAMFVDKFDGSQLPMLGAGFEAAIDNALAAKAAS